MGAEVQVPRAGFAAEQVEAVAEAEAQESGEVH